MGHITRDSMAIEVRERFPEQTAQRHARQSKHAPKKPTRSKKESAQKQLTPKPIGQRKRGRPKKSERALSGRHLPRQLRQTLQEMLSELPRDCRIGVKTSSQGYRRHWRERVNGRLKEEFGGRTSRVRGAQKVMAHLMFGILALTVDPLLRLAG